MRVVISPYHLTSREPAAMASLLLGAEVVTLLPSPVRGADRRAVTTALATRPSYLSMFDSWAWTTPLWRAGVIAPDLAGRDALDDARAVVRDIEDEPAFAGLRPLMHPGLFDGDERYLDTVARDVLRAGPDPGVCVPIAAALDRFAAREGCFVARSEPVSVAQRAEARWMTDAGSGAFPVLLQADGARLVEARERLAPELEEVRGTIAGLAGAGASGAAAVAGAARRFAEAFEREREDLTRAPDDPDEPRVIAGTVRVTVGTLPPDAVLRSSVCALRAMQTGEGAPAAAPDAAAPARDLVPVVRVLVVRVVGGPRAR